MMVSLATLPTEVTLYITTFDCKTLSPTYKQTLSLVQRVVTLSLVCMKLYQELYKLETFRYLHLLMNPLFRQPLKDVLTFPKYMRALKDSYTTARPWCTKKELACTKTEFNSDVEQHAFYDTNMSMLNLYDKKYQDKKNFHLYGLTDNLQTIYHIDGEGTMQKLETGMHLKAYTLNCYPSIASGNGTVAFVSGDNHIFVLTENTKKVTISVTESDGSAPQIQQIEMKNNLLFVRTKAKDLGYKLRIYEIRDCKCTEKDVCALPSETLRFYLLEKYIILFLNKADTRTFKAYLYPNHKSDKRVFQEAFSIDVSAKEYNHNLIVNEMGIFSIYKTLIL